MTKKMTLILAILFVFLMTVTAVSAEDNLTDSMIASEDTATFDNLTSEIEAVDDGGEYNLSRDYVYESGPADGIKINKSITINGNNHKIDAMGQSRIFNTYEGNITLKNLILANGFADKGGAILARSAITLINVTFISNHADEGGAIYIHTDISQENYTPPVFTDCVFDANTAKNGAAIYLASALITTPADDTNGSGIPDDDDEGDDYTPDDDDDGDTPSEDDGDTPSEDDGDTPSEDEGDTPSEDEDDENETGPYDEFIITGSVFKNSHGIKNGLIYIDNPLLLAISNSSFENSTSEYGTAFYSPLAASVKIFNCTFENLHSSKSGGCFCGPRHYLLSIDESNFTNISSQNNGGAICFDVSGWDLLNPFDGRTIISRSHFVNIKSRFGGCLVQTGGELLISDSSFENCTAFSGGAIYVSTTKAEITGSTFKNNVIDDMGNGGAINEFRGRLTVSNSTFISNRKNALYCADNEYNITGCYFENNSEAVHSLYVISRHTSLNNCTDDVMVENTTDEDYYILTVSSTGAALTLVRNDIDVGNLPVRFDSRDFGWITPVRDQGQSGACWVFSTCSCLEAALLKSTGIEYDLSINNIQKNLIAYSKYGNYGTGESGFISMAAKFILSWYGAFNSTYEGFDLCGKITSTVAIADAVHVQDILRIANRENSTDIEAVKRAIMKYGAVTSDISIDYNPPYFNSETSALYFNDTEGNLNHAICVVGWDDTYSADNFLITPPGDGAWIVKNSYGEQNYDHGYIYVSYYDTMFAKGEMMAFIFENTENYTKNYQTDIGGEIHILTDRANYTYKNTYRAIEDDFISAVGTYFENNESYTIEIYVNGQLKHTQSGVSPFRGYHTVMLEKDIPVKSQDEFTVEVKKTSMPLVNTTNQHFTKGASLADWGEGWFDLSDLNATATLKVYTKALVNLTPEIIVSDMTVVYNSGKYLTVTVRDVYGDAVKGVGVTITLSNGAVKKLTTDANGQVKLSLNNLVSKIYTATVKTDAFANYLSATSTAKITVKKASVKLTAKSKTFRMKKKTKKLTVTLKDTAKRAVKKVKITLRVKGKTYSAKTNAKGRATFKITKLTKKGSFKAKVKFAGNSCYNAAAKNIKIKVR